MTSEAMDLLQPMSPRRTLPEQIASELERLIVNGKLANGDHLLSERNLAEKFKVSRSVVREAMKALAFKGLLTVQPGRQTQVRHLCPDQVAQSLLLLTANPQSSLSPDQISEVRAPLEMEIASLAAQRRTPNELLAIQAHMAAFPERSPRPASVAWDIEFHLLLAKATQNSLFEMLLRALVGSLNAVMSLSLQQKPAPQNMLRQHQAIVEAVEDKDAPGAAAAMKAHLEDARKNMRRTLLLDAKKSKS